MPEFNYRPQQRAWLEALRSGKIRQAKNVLNDGNGGMCCLGVACDLAVKAGLPVDVGSKNVYGQHQRVRTIAYDGKKGLPPASVVEWMGFTTFQDKMGFTTFQDILAWMNDEGRTFEQIADEVEAHPSRYLREADDVF